MKMRELIKSLFGKKLAALASHKIASIAIAATVVAGAGTGTAVVAYNHSKAANSVTPSQQIVTTTKPKAKTDENTANSVTSNNTAATPTAAASSNATPAAPAADPNQAKYDAAKAKAGSRLGELLSGLKKLGYDVAADTVDARTYNSILTFQHDCGLTPDGIPGDATFNALAAKLNPSSSSSSKSSGSNSSSGYTKGSGSGSTGGNSSYSGSSSSSGSGNSNSNGGGSSQASLPSPAELEAKYSYMNNRHQTDYTQEIYNQLDNIWNNYLSNHNASAETSAMYAIHLNVGDGLYNNVRVEFGHCGTAIIKPGMNDLAIGTAIGDSQGAGGFYDRFKIVDNGNGTYTVYGLGAYITTD